MISASSDLLERFGGHRGAGGLTVKRANIDKLIQNFQNHCNACIQDNDMIKTVKVDTKIYHHERENSTLEKLQQLAPFGQGNPEPCFLIEDIEVQKIEKVGTNGKSHLKIHGKIGEKTITSMFRGKGAERENITNTHLSIVGKIKKDNYNG